MARRTEQETELLCKNRCKELGVEFTKWATFYMGIKTRVIAHCPDCGCSVFKKTTVNNLLNKRTVGCQSCHSKNKPESDKQIGNYGYYPHKQTERDCLYLLKIRMPDGNIIIKVGRTFNINERIGKLRQVTGATIEILDRRYDTHINVFMAETKLKLLLYPYRHKADYEFSGFSTECFEKHIVTHTAIKEFFEFEC